MGHVQYLLMFAGPTEMFQQPTTETPVELIELNTIELDFI